jgi:diguanylate cyclase
MTRWNSAQLTTLGAQVKRAERAAPNRSTMDAPVEPPRPILATEKAIWRLTPLQIEIAIALAAFLAACTAIYLTRVPGGIALFWPASAIAGACLIRAPQIHWTRVFVLLLLAFLCANLCVGRRTLEPAVLLSCVGLLEVGMMVAAFRVVWAYPYPQVGLSQAGTMTAVFGVAIPGVNGLVGAAAMRFCYGTPFWTIAAQWWGSHTIGACLLGPPIILFSMKRLRRLVRPDYFWQNALSCAVCLFGTYLLIRYVRFPFVAVGLLLLIASFRLGGLGASLLSLATGLLITNLWAFGLRPLGLDAAVPTGTLIGLPILALLATVMPPVSVGIGSDARRTTARALQASERHFRESMAHSPVGMLISSLDGIWRYTNLALQEMLGYTAEEFRALPPGGPSDPEDWRTSESRWGPLIRGEIPVYHVDRRFRHKDGRWIWTRVAVSLLRDADGTPLNLIAQIENIEARRQAEAVLAAERERLRITLHAIADAVVTTDTERRITLVNPAATALLGLNAATMTGRRLDEVIHLVDPVSLKSAPSMLAMVTMRGELRRREQPCLLHRADGTAVYVRDTVSPVLDGSGQLTGLVVVFHDASADMDRTRELEDRATYDALTGLVNRAEFVQRLTGAFERGLTLDKASALLALDLDRFKAVNDSGGHAAGDEILRRVAAVCQEHVRASDTVARLGGDEFAILLANCDLDRARAVGEKLMRALNPLAISWHGATLSVGASLGIAPLTRDLQTPQQWLAAADAACYEAKGAGRGALRLAHG